jgi:tetratricopeptide (TPR) repeat protein
VLSLLQFHEFYEQNVCGSTCRWPVTNLSYSFVIVPMSLNLRYVSMIKKLSSACFVSALVLSSSLVLTACDGVEERKAKYLEQAQESFAAKDYDKAKLGYKNVIQIDPKDIDARLGLARVLVSQKEWRDAAGQYLGVLELDKEHIEASVELGKLYLLARGQEQALEQADKILAKHPDNLDALALKAGILAQKGQVSEALMTLERILAADSGHSDAAMMYGSLASANGDSTKALSVLQTAFAKHPDNIDLLSVQVGIHHGLAQHDQAIALLKQIIDKRPDNFAHKQRLVAYLASIERDDEAKTLLQDYIKLDDDTHSARKALVSLLLTRLDYAAAETTLTGFIREFENEYDFRLQLAQVKAQQADLAAAKQVLSEIISKDMDGPNAIKARVQMARIHLAEKAKDLAKTELEKVLGIEPNNAEALMLRGSFAYEEKRYVDAINDFRVALKNDPDDATVTQALADTHFQAGEFHLAETYYKQLITRFPNELNARDKLAKIHAQSGKFDEALALRLEMEKFAPDAGSNLIEIAKLYMSKNDKPALTAIIDRMMKTGSLQATALYFKGLLAQSNDAHADALAAFDESLRLVPNSIEPISAKVKSLLALKRNADAKAWLKQLVVEQDKNTVARNLYGELLLTEGSKAEAEQQFRAIIALTPKWHVPYRNLALLYRSDQRLPEALKVLQEGADAVSDPLSLRQELAQLHLLQNNTDAAIAEYEKLYALASAPESVANNLAMLLVTHKTDAKSLERAAQIAEKLRGSNNPMHLDTLGWIYLKKNQVDLALPLIKRAAEKAPDDPSINYHLAQVYHAKADNDAARRHVEKALASERGFSERDAAKNLLLSIETL